VDTKTQETPAQATAQTKTPITFSFIEKPRSHEPYLLCKIE
jgi:hypothetical protein